MKTSKQWLDYFSINLTKQRINWQQKPQLLLHERKSILKSLQAWQLGETSDGSHLLQATNKYAVKVNDVTYVEAVKLFIKEEQKHGNNLGRYLDLISEPRIKKNWGDTLFRKIRYFNTNMELWTLTVITVESAAQIFYQSLKDATNCPLLKQICSDILIDEAAHIQFQHQRMQIIFQTKKVGTRTVSVWFYKFFFLSTALVVWMAHKKLFKAGKNNFNRYYRKMYFKMNKTIGKLSSIHNEKLNLQLLNA